ncbi:MAG: DUF5919 domain-containing protein [Bacteroidota bacterium]
MGQREQRLRTIIKAGFTLLNDKKGYSQRSVVKKLNMLGLNIGAASFNKIIKDKAVSRATLQKVAEAIKELVMLELGYHYEEERGFVQAITADWQAKVVPELSTEEKDNSGLQFHTEGRVSIEYKRNFFHNTEKELIEVGVRLHTFTNYFISRNPTEYRKPIEQLLEKGVTIKLFLLDPESNAARLYFEDRTRIFPNEKHAIEETRRVVEKLAFIKRDFDQQDLKGQFEIYTYKHIPQNHFLIVDGDSLHGKMMTSHYIYGLRRAECPVLEFTRKDNRSLFRKYWNAYTQLVQGAKPL